MENTVIEDISQFLTFTLNDELFAVEIMKVREVLDLTSITKVPRTPEFMLGVINLRGSVVPVFDMRAKFGMPPAPHTVNTCIIIMEINMDGEDIVIGTLVDSVQEVFELKPDQVQPPPKIGTKLDIEFIRGMGKNGNSFVIILDIDRAFSSIEIETASHSRIEAA